MRFVSFSSLNNLNLWKSLKLSLLVLPEPLSLDTHLTFWFTLFSCWAFFCQLYFEWRRRSERKKSMKNDSDKSLHQDFSVCQTFCLTFNLMFNTIGNITLNTRRVFRLMKLTLEDYSEKIWNRSFVFFLLPILSFPQLCGLLGMTQSERSCWRSVHWLNVSLENYLFTFNLFKTFMCF